MKDSISRVMLIGLDGATWNVIQPMLNQGKLPNLKHIMETGVYGNLRSLEYAVSPRVWTSIATGKSEEKHGILDFYNSIKDLKAKRIWDILIENNNETANIFYWYLTWPPPKNFKKVMVPGFLARDSQTIPPQLSFIKDMEITQKMKLQESYDTTGLSYYISQAIKAWQNGLKFSTMFKALSFLLGQKFKNYEELDYFHKVMLLKYHIHTDVFKHLINKDPVDFSAIMIPQPDQLGHKYWHFMEPDDFEKRTGIKVTTNERRKYGNVIRNIYSKIDRFIGKVHQRLNENDLLIVLSDHGFGPVKEIYASLRIKSNSFLELLGLTGVAHCVSLGFSYFIQLDDPKKVNELDQIKTMIENITLSDSNLKVFEVHKNSEKEIVIKLQNLVLMTPKDAKEFMNKKLKIKEKIVAVDEIFINRPDITGEHEPLGIFLMKGKHIKKYVEINEVSVFDIVPTILYWKGLPVAKDMDGSVLTHAIEEPYFKSHPIQFIDTYETQDTHDDQDDNDYSMTKELESRLESLGYLG